MSTLVAQNVGNGSVSTSMANVVNGSAKAWVNFNGTSGAIRSSYNVSSATRSSTGVYTISFTNALADANYVISGSSARVSSETAGNIISPEDVTTARTASSCLVRTQNTAAGALTDSTVVNIAFFR